MVQGIGRGWKREVLHPRFQNSFGHTAVKGAICTCCGPPCTVRVQRFSLQSSSN